MMDNHEKPMLIVLSGPSGAGKDAVLSRMKDKNLPYCFTVTATTRTRRSDEIEGVDYIFVSKNKFETMIENDELLEWAEVYGNLYGVPKYQITAPLKDGKDVIVKTDVQGAATIKRLIPEAILVFLSVENPSDLETRLAARMTETNSSLNLRVDTAKSEIAEAASFDHVLINKQNKLDETVKNFEAIIEVERSRSSN